MSYRRIMKTIDKQSYMWNQGSSFPDYKEALISCTGRAEEKIQHLKSQNNIDP